MRRLTVLEFERFCNENKYTQFIFNIANNENEFIGVGNCSASMKFVTVRAIPCPDSIYFMSKHKETYISFTNVIRVDFEEGSDGIANIATIICRNSDETNGEERYKVIVDKK